MTAERFVYGFSEESGADDPPILLGGKGAGLAKMRQLGLPVPEGFTITTRACRRYMQHGDFPEGLMQQVMERLDGLQKATGRRFGEPESPLLVSVRSGAPVSMPGMMDTVLNLGLNHSTVEGLAKSTGDERLAYDAYRRFIQMFGKVVLGVKGELFEAAIEELKRSRGVEDDTELSPQDLRNLADKFKEIIVREGRGHFPEEPEEQLKQAIRAVFDSWMNDRAVAYRREYEIPESLCTAVTVQRMVFGNMGEDSATGVAFTRNPSTGDQGVFGEFLLNAQGEDVVAGIRTPRPLDEMGEVLPEAHRKLLSIMQTLECEYKDMQDIEFTVEKGRLYMLQTRAGKRTAAAALKIARDMAQEGIISREEAILRIEPGQLSQLLHPRIDPTAEVEVLAKGLGASPGAATGKIVLTAEEAKVQGETGEAVLLVRKETNPDDVEGVISSRGVLTALGGMTSHAAVVARGMGKPAVTGCKALEIDLEAGKIRLSGREYKAGDVLTIDGATGDVIAGEVPLVDAGINEDFQELLLWTDEYRVLGVRANADTPEDARKARSFGAEGIGLCRTEHMFMQEERLRLMRQMILSEERDALQRALNKLQPLQQEDFMEIFKAMDGLPVTVRLLDPPLHEFLPDSKELRVRLAGAQPGEEADSLKQELKVVERLEEANPMLGLRGVRLGILHPEVYRMQVKAIVQAVKAVRAEGYTPVVEIMIPLIGFPAELDRMRALVEEELGEEQMHIGTMIELPRACIVAGEIAQHADFFSFGTNDLTQTACGMSRDDAEEKFLPAYLEEGVLEENPFEHLDQEGVGRLISMACELGRGTDAGLKLGICGEHGGDPKSINFFHKVRLDYVSCSPYRVPVARLAAAQTALSVAE